MEVVTRDTVVLAHVALGLVPEILDAVDVMAGGCDERLMVVDPTMPEAGDSENVVAAEAIRVDDGIRPYFGSYDGHQRLGAGIRDHLGVNATAAFENAEHGHFAGGAAASLALALTAEIALVDLDLTADRACVLDADSDDLAQPMIEQRRSILVDADELSRGPGRRSGDEVFTQPVGLFFRELGIP